jgi:hypothetical protein
MSIGEKVSVGARSEEGRKSERRRDGKCCIVYITNMHPRYR